MLDSLRVALSRVRSALTIGRVDGDFQKELTSHIELATEESLLATWIPAQRALSLDPLILLRQE